MTGANGRVDRQTTPSQGLVPDAVQRQDSTQARPDFGSHPNYRCPFRLFGRNIDGFPWFFFGGLIIYQGSPSISPKRTPMIPIG